MNDKDKEAFTQKFTFWINHYPSDRLNDWGLYELMKSAWQAACEYKQEEITLLENQISYLEETIDSFMDEPDIVIKKLQAKNAELDKKLEIAVEVLKVVSWHYSDDGSHDPDEMYDAIEQALAAIKAINED